jgi:hypothetical protein
VWVGGWGEGYCVSKEFVGLPMRKWGILVLRMV